MNMHLCRSVLAEWAALLGSHMTVKNVRVSSELVTAAVLRAYKDLVQSNMAAAFLRCLHSSLAANGFSSAHTRTASSCTMSIICKRFTSCNAKYSGRKACIPMQHATGTQGGKCKLAVVAFHLACCLPRDRKLDPAWLLQPHDTGERKYYPTTCLWLVTKWFHLLRNSLKTVAMCGVTLFNFTLLHGKRIWPWSSTVNRIRCLYHAAVYETSENVSQSRCGIVCSSSKRCKLDRTALPAGFRHQKSRLPVQLKLPDGCKHMHCIFLQIQQQPHKQQSFSHASFDINAARDLREPFVCLPLLTSSI